MLFSIITLNAYLTHCLIRDVIVLQILPFLYTVSSQCTLSKITGYGKKQNSNNDEYLAQLKI